MCGGILIFEGWRLDPILLLCQMLTSAMVFIFLSESIGHRSHLSNASNINAKGSEPWVLWYKREFLNCRCLRQVVSFKSYSR